MIRYYKLLDMMNRKEKSKNDLRKILSSATVAKIQKGEYLSMEAIEKLCKYFNCQPGDLMEYIPDEEEKKEIKIGNINQSGTNNSININQK